MTSPYYMGTDGHFFIRDEQDDFADIFDVVVTENSIRRHIPNILSPCLIFVKTDYLRNPYIMRMLLCQTDAFVLVTGSSDISPSLCFPEETSQLLNSTKLQCWFAENNASTDPKMRSLPVGLTYHNRKLQLSAERHLHLLRTSTAPLSQRRKSIYARWRHRHDNICGPDYDQRTEVQGFVQSNPEVFYYVTDELCQTLYFQQLQQHQFVLCPHGNGLDPSPRAWEAMILKVIPIVKSSVLVNGIYTDLPCLIIEAWEELLDWKFLETYKERIEHIEEMLRDDYYLYRLSRSWWHYQILMECKKSVTDERFRLLYRHEDDV